jgi:hypothetical protein
MPKMSFRKSRDSPIGFLKEQSIHYAAYIASPLST